MPEVFISYKRQQRAKARAIAEAVAKCGYDVWWDVELLPGDKFSDAIEAVVRRSRAAVVLWSEESVKSDFVRAEALLALQRDILIPVRLDDVNIPLPFGTVQTLDLSAWNGSPEDPSLQPLLAAIKLRLGRTEPTQHTAKEVENILRRPEEESEYWRSISEKVPPEISEYKAYLERYGEGALFADLARIRIQRLSTEDRKPWPKVAKIFAGVAAVIALLGGVAEIADRFGAFDRPAKVGPVASDDKSNATTPPTSVDAEEVTWEFVKESRVPEAIDKFLLKYPDSKFVSEARMLLNSTRDQAPPTRFWQFEPGRPKQIHVCFEDDPSEFNDEVIWLREAISDSWERYSQVRFVGWGICRENSRGARIKVEDGPPVSFGLGMALDGRKDGVTQNFTFKSWQPACAATKKLCVQAYAVHEFGHILGFAHEHLRNDAPPECRTKFGWEGVYPDETFTPYDEHSVMNFCNPVFGNNSKLSALDIVKLRSIYGE